MVPTIYFIRHGETYWNAEQRLQGQTDTDMNAKGRVQVQECGERLASVLTDPGRFDFVASPLTRTTETMEIVRNALGLPQGGARFDDRLKEVHYGDWQGSTWEELRALVPQAVAARFDDPWSYVPPAGESYAMLSQRTLDWFASVKRDTIAVAHGGLSRVLRGHLSGTLPRDIPLMDAPQDKVLVIEGGEFGWL